MASKKLEENTTVAVQNVCQSASKEDVTEHFSYCGDITDVLLLSDPHNPGSNRAVISYGSAAAAETALLLTDSIWRDQEITVTSVKISPSRFTLDELKVSLASLVSKSKPPTADGAQADEPAGRREKRGKMSGTERRTQENFEHYTKKVKGMSSEHKAAMAGGLCLLAAGLLAGGKYVTKKRKSELEHRNRCLISAYDHLLSES